ncbi:acetyltransferase [Schizosaccharomyces japonicus yFS275]|uniref:Acetyltransferase n=1 Tax=Schizosaccharomyces japonicus (strain yFS275 / FY16936) TaxID=402676 RepID=B6JV44_SCHJY|nr:acetyltransferase [Schizosaccharomyces japonicus yFS275]EEB05245.1 acetyltransferase [Schizosaccharomyces japonicus yFS275]
MTGNISVREYEDKDYKSVLQLIVSIQREEFGIPITAEEQPDLHDIHGFYQTGRGNFWVACDNGNIVATVGVKDMGNEEVALRKLFVSSPYRGAQYGTSNLLLQTVFDFCQKHGIRRLYLGTTDVFARAINFYKKRGFKQIEESSLPSTFPRLTVDTIFFTHEFPKPSEEQH